MQCVFLFRLDLILHAIAEFFFRILNFTTKQGVTRLAGQGAKGSCQGGEQFL